MNRFYVPRERVSYERVDFTDDQRRQMRNVLRLRVGDRSAAFDGSGREYLVEIDTLDESQASGRILDTTAPATEPSTRLVLIQGLPKGEKIDLILQKCTEIGVSEFLIVETARSVPRIPPARLTGRLERWRAIVREAAEQSGRVCLPTVNGIGSFSEAVSRASECDLGLMAWEGEKERVLSPGLPGLSDAREVALLIGPEGSFTESEVSTAAQAGITPVSLGPRILRTETASIVGSAFITYGKSG